jgi:L-asparaginase
MPSTDVEPDAAEPSAHASTVVILGTGGTIAGTASNPQDLVGYRAAQLTVADLVAAVPALQGQALESEQVAQVDSADMTHAIWQQLARRVHAHLQRAEVAGVVITHGTDTLEETAYFLHRVLAPSKPVVLTAAMRPATALQADGPQNLLDAVTLARQPGACGVLVAFGGQVLAGAELRKVHTFRLDAFDAGEAGPLGVIEQGVLRRWRDWPGAPLHAQALGLQLERIAAEAQTWPRVEIITSHAGSDGRIVQALLDQGVQGLVVACVGNGGVHEQLAAALATAEAQGVRISHAPRVARGVIVGAPPGSGGLTPVQARIELLLDLLGAPTSAA